MGAQCESLTETSRTMYTSEQAADVDNNHCDRSSQSSHPHMKHRRTYSNHHPNSNVILISAALVLLLNSPCAHLPMGGPTRWKAQAFDPYTSSIKTPSLFRYGTATSSSCFRPSTIRTTDTTSNYISIRFFSPPTTQYVHNQRSPLSHQLHSTEKSKSSSSSSWSKAAMSTTTSTNEQSTKRTRRESRIGVRRRVKSVLKKASRRTGIRNNSDDDTPTWKVPKQQAASVVADAASIGGLGAVIVDEETGKVDVAFDYIPSPATDNEDEEEEQEEEENDTTESWIQPVNGSALKSSTNNDANGTTIKISTKEKKITKKKKKKKTPPASTYSPPIGKPEPYPDESLVVASPTKKSTTTSASTQSSSSLTSSSSSTSCDEMDVFKSDVSAAFSLPPPPLPFTLPKLTRSQKALLKSGERVQFQSEMGREGSGFVVLDVKAPLSVVWNCLLDFQSYPDTISGVKNVQMDAVDGGNLNYGQSGTSRATFTLSRKFGLRISVVHKYKTHPMGDHMIFELDEENRNFVLNKAKGVWFTETEGEDLEPGSTRIWLLAELRVSSLLPRFIVDYAAKKAFPKATKWIKPHVETAASLWLRSDKKE